MPYRRMTIASAVTVVILAAIAIAALHRVPADAQLAIHWNAAGQADGFAGAGYALLLPVILTAVLSIMLAALPSLEPLQEKLGQSAVLYRTTWAVLLCIMALVELNVAAPAFGVTPPRMLIVAMVGIALIAIGNVLPKSRPGFFVGIRTPWALIDEDNWVATHRLGARTMIAAGAILLVSSALPLAAGARQAVFWVAIVLAVVPPWVLSWWMWHRQRPGAA